MNPLILMACSGNNQTQASTSFDVTIQTSGVDDTFTLPTVSGYTYNATVDWGDGGATSAITAYDDADITHTYATEDSYTIKITGTFPAWSFNNAGDKLMVTAVHFGSDVLFEYLQKGFYGCSNLVSITGQIGDSGITTSVDCFAGCTSLLSIPSGLFDNNTSVTTFSGCFSGCTSLLSIPSGLFDNNTSVTTFAGCFSGCTSLTGSSGELWLNPSGAGNYTLSAPDYDIGVPEGNSCYFNCTGLSDYASIPTYWK
jgi:hypothetical protein